MAVTEGLVREEQLLHDMCLLSATTVEITQILTRAGPKGLKYIWTPLKMETGLVIRWNVLTIYIYKHLLLSSSSPFSADYRKQL